MFSRWHWLVLCVQVCFWKMCMRVWVFIQIRIFLGWFFYSTELYSTCFENHEVLWLWRPSERLILITFWPFISKEQRGEGEHYTLNLAKQRHFDRFHLDLKCKVECTGFKLKNGLLETLSKTLEEPILWISILKKGRGEEKDKHRNTATNTASVRWAR